MKKYIAPMLALPLIAVLSASAGQAAHIKDKTMCLQTWKAYKAQYRSEHKTRGAFMRECRAGTLPPQQPKGTATQ